MNIIFIPPRVIQGNLIESADLIQAEVIDAPAVNTLIQSGPPGQTGSPGPTGSTGPQGPQGPQGIQGLRGFTGNQGPQGVVGPDGPQGLPGIQGPQGPQGVHGVKGDKGDQGDQGPQGTKGATGATGAAGHTPVITWDGDRIDIDGTLGPNLTGPTGPAGAKGNKGDTGAQGPAGTNGVNGRTVLNGAGAPGVGLGANGDFYIDTTADTIYGPKAGGAWPAPVSLVGPTGAAGTNGIDGTNGTNGKSVLSGAGAPAGGTGVDGDFYIDTTADAIYGPKAGGVWGASTSLIGPQGVKGDTGLKGDKGDTGAGVPTLGTAGQALVKVSGTDYDTTWRTLVLYGTGDPPDPASLPDGILYVKYSA